MYSHKHVWASHTVKFRSRLCPSRSYGGLAVSSEAVEDLCCWIDDMMLTRSSSVGSPNAKALPSFLAPPGASGADSSDVFLAAAESMVPTAAGAAACVEAVAAAAIPVPAATATGTADGGATAAETCRAGTGGAGGTEAVAAGNASAAGALAALALAAAAAACCRPCCAASRAAKFCSPRLTAIPVCMPCICCVCTCFRIPHISGDTK